jgi:hypothetical protein
MRLLREEIARSLRKTLVRRKRIAGFLSPENFGRADPLTPRHLPHRRHRPQHRQVAAPAIERVEEWSEEGGRRTGGGLADLPT